MILYFTHLKFLFLRVVRRFFFFCSIFLQEICKCSMDVQWKKPMGIGLDKMSSSGFGAVLECCNNFLEQS